MKQGQTRRLTDEEQKARQKKLKQLDISPHQFNLALTLFNIGEIKRDLANTEDAKVEHRSNVQIPPRKNRYFKNAMEILSSMEEQNMQALNFLGILNHEMGNDSSVFYFNKALGIKMDIPKECDISVDCSKRNMQLRRYVSFSITVRC
jgi:tetratricopeptide (TPR) repeat protein